MPTAPCQRILLGVTGGIACYKSPDLVRRLRERGADVTVVMTAAARAFVTPLTFQAVSGRPVRTDLWDEGAEAAMGHIELARWADCVLVAPATADFMARLAHGHADDLLTTLCLATTAPIVLAPAMNWAMWQHPATQANRVTLEGRGVRLLGPATGPLAEGESGPGRMLEPLEIVAALFDVAPGPLAGRRVLVTAGPTREPLDPIRYLGNRSSGKMGFALARAAAAAGARVTLVAGPVALATPAGVERVDVETAAEMHAAVMRYIEGQDIFIAAAAVGDFAPAEPSATKLKKTAGDLTLKLERTPDILAGVAARRPRPFLVGFAAETHDLERYARSKLAEKKLDMIAANLVGDGRGFERDENALSVYWPGGAAELPLDSKERLAERLIALIAERYAAR
ncbi:MAG TPA: bifunctional phosphopantothenoylcysteine decarboxylase/phosphopantothenate--cysteine ligase CoaBC [Gammaproteobacteria bacterium]|nr:bifunctional phosphopantothenoylcysteine decarboxylase/phosphopantothenate--cysteine ligase CoaBC [Gammaproteobacteria bacterium]